MKNIPPVPKLYAQFLELAFADTPPSKPEIQLPAELLEFVFASCPQHELDRLARTGVYRIDLCMPPLIGFISPYPNHSDLVSQFWQYLPDTSMGDPVISDDPNEWASGLTEINRNVFATPCRYAEAIVLTLLSGGHLITFSQQAKSHAYFASESDARIYRMLTDMRGPRRVGNVHQVSLYDPAAFKSNAEKVVKRVIPQHALPLAV